MKKNIAAVKLLIDALHGRADVLNLIGRNDEAMTDAMQLVRESQAIGDNQNSAEGYHQASIIYSKMSDYRNMKIYAEKALKLYRKISDREGQSSTTAYIAEYYLIRGKFDKTQEYYTKALDLISDMKESKEYMNQLNNQATFYSDYIGDFDKVIAIQRRILKVSRKKGFRQIEGASLNNLIRLYQRTGDIEKALEYGEKALDITASIGDKDGIATILNNIAALNYYLGKREKSIGIFNESLLIRQQIGDKRGMSICHNNIGFIYEGSGNFNAAYEHYSKSLALREQIGDRSGQSETLNNLSSYYRSIKDYKKALEYAGKSLKIRRKMQDRRGIKLCLKRMADIYSDIHDFKSALDNIVEFINEADRDEIKNEYLKIGNAHYKAGKIGEAEKYFLKIVKVRNIDPAKKTEALFGLCDIAFLNDKPGKAGKYIDELKVQGNDGSAGGRLTIYNARLNNRLFACGNVDELQSASAVSLMQDEMKADESLCSVILKCELLILKGKKDDALELCEREDRKYAGSGNFQAAGEMAIQIAVFMEHLDSDRAGIMRNLARERFKQGGLDEWADLCAK